MDDGSKVKSKKKVKFCSGDSLVMILEIPPRENVPDDDADTDSTQESSSDSDSSSDASSSDETDSLHNDCYKAVDLDNVRKMTSAFSSLSPRNDNYKKQSIRAFPVSRPAPQRFQGKMLTVSRCGGEKPANKPVQPTRRAQTANSVGRNAGRRSPKNHLAVTDKYVRRRPTSPMTSPRPRLIVEMSKLSQRRSSVDTANVVSRRRYEPTTLSVGAASTDTNRRVALQGHPAPYTGATTNGTTFQAATEALIKELPWLTLPRIHYSPYRQWSAPPTQHRTLPTVSSDHMGATIPVFRSIPKDFRADSTRSLWNPPVTSQLFKEENCVSQMWDFTSKSTATKSTT